MFNIVDSYVWGKNRKGTRCYISTATVVTRTRYSVTYVNCLVLNLLLVMQSIVPSHGFRSVDLSWATATDILVHPGHPSTYEGGQQPTMTTIII